MGMSTMDIQRVNQVLECAILGLQEGEAEHLWERAMFKVPTPKQMAKKHGMALTLSADDVMAQVDKALDPLIAGHGKLTDPNRTPKLGVVVAALQQVVDTVPRLKPGDRKDVLDQLRGWGEYTRAHAKRLDQARGKRGVEIDMGHVSAARKIRDEVKKVIAIVKKYKGGGFMKIAARKEDKPKAPPKPKKPVPVMAGGLGRGPIVGDGTVSTFLGILESVLEREARSSGPDIEREDYQKGMAALKAKMKKRMGSEDGDDLEKMADFAEDEFSWSPWHGNAAIGDIVENWLEQVKAFVRSKKLPHAYPGTKVKPWVDPRQIGMKYESQQPMWSLVGLNESGAKEKPVRLECQVCGKKFRSKKVGVFSPGVDRCPKCRSANVDFAE
jgi:hypothetical protein